MSMHLTSKQQTCIPIVYIQKVWLLTLAYIINTHNIMTNSHYIQVTNTQGAMYECK
jgi:hypothetical protein